MSLPKTVEEVIVKSRVQTLVCDTAPCIDGIVGAVLLAAGIKIDDDGKTLIYPSTTGTDTPRYQVAEQRNVRFRGKRRK